MITLVFPLAGVLLLAEHAFAATSRAASMREVLDGTAPRPALWRVGDHGVFLMSNGLVTPADADHTTGLSVVHAAGYTTHADWLTVADEIGRGNQIRIVLPLRDPAFGERILHRDLAGGADAGAVDFVIELDARHLRWHLPATTTGPAGST